MAVVPVRNMAISFIPGSTVHEVSHLLIFGAEKSLFDGDYVCASKRPFITYNRYKVHVGSVSAPDDPETKWHVSVFLPGRDEIAVNLEDGSKSVIEAQLVLLIGHQPFASKTCLFQKDATLSRPVCDFRPDFVDLRESAKITFESLKIPHGGVTCRLDIKYRKHGPVEAAVAEDCDEHIVIQHSTLGTDLLSLLQKPSTSDVTFAIGERQWHLHRCVLSARSPVFAAMFSNSMKENKLNCVVPVEDSDPDAFDAFVRFIYMDSLDDVCKDVFSAALNGPMKTAEKLIVIFCELLSLSDRYDIPKLKNLCEERLSRRLSVENVLYIVAKAYMHETKILYEAAKKFAVLNMSELVNKTEFSEFLRGNSKLACEILKLSSGNK